MAKAKKTKIDDVEQEELQPEEEIEETEDDTEEEKPKGRQIPKHAVNFTDVEIKKMNVENSVKGLLQAKRQADEEGDKTASRKIRRALRAQGFYVSKVREDM